MKIFNSIQTEKNVFRNFILSTHPQYNTRKRTLSNNQIHEKIGDFLCCTIFTILLIGQKILLIEWKLMSQKMGNQNIFHRDFLKIHKKRGSKVEQYKGIKSVTVQNEI